ncbi:hypothetical protein MMC22_000129 [Lobaria immixta]|nr:hypothetical protein [Lobaria immixta]
MSLTSLPPELLSCVVANIASQATLSSLARCSRQLYLLTTPRLYRHVEIQKEVGLGKQQKSKLESLARLLIQRPDLARLVRHFTLHAAMFSRVVADYSNEPEELHESHDQPFATAINASSCSIEEKIKCLGQISHRHFSHEDLILAFLLPTLLKVEKLVLDLKIDYDTYYLEEVMRRAASGERPFGIQSPFKALKVIVLSHDLFYARSPSFMASLLKLPAIQRVSAGIGTIRVLDNEIPTEFRPTGEILTELDSFSSPLTSLNLAAYRLSGVDLDNVFRAPKALKALFYKFCPPDCIKVADLRHALKPQENYLESLSLDFDIVFYRNDRSYLMPMTSFIGFSTLKVFKIAAAFLEKTVKGTERNNLLNIFPLALETLHLFRFRACFKGVLESLEHLLARKSPQQVPLLQKLFLEEAYSFDAKPTKLRDVLWRDTQEIAIERLGRVAAIQGVSLDITEESIVASPKGVRATIARSEEKRQEEFVQGFLKLDE